MSYIKQDERWTTIGNLVVLQEDAKDMSDNRFPKHFISKNGGSWFVFDFAGFPVIGPFDDVQAAMAALLVVK